jgi:hypothetical protein
MLENKEKITGRGVFLPRQLLMLALCAAVSGTWAGLPGTLHADDAPTTRPVHHRPIRFVPNVDSAPANLGTATSRGHSDDPNLAVSVIAPQDREGLTMQESPTLFWYTTKPTTSKIEIALVKEGDLKDVKPLVKVDFRDPFASGLQRLDLEKAGVKLEVNVRYKWSVSVIDPEGHSGDLVSQAIIRRIDPAGQPQPADPADRIRLLAEKGIWYDMLGELSAAIDADPGNADLRQQRASLLEQSALPALPKELKDWAGGKTK